ncbi:MAG: hypothetical protein SH868_10050 [Bythopirellula sp.]|nr:hypothetical protein [Bythopirellula sp.]
MALLVAVFITAPLRGQDAPSDSELAKQEASLSQRYNRLELLAGRLAEMSKATQPRRAELLQQLVAKSREKDLPGRFDTIVEALRQDDLGDATQNQTALQTELQAMLELLLQEDRDRQIESERQRISKYLAELNKLIRQQRGIRARTAGGDFEQELAEDQGGTAKKTGELSDKIEETEVSEKKDSEQKGGAEDSQSKPSAGKNQPGKNSDGKPSESKPGEPSEKSREPKEGSSGDPKESQSGEPKPSESKPGQSQSGESKPGESQSGESQPSESQPSQSPPSQSQGESGQPSGESGESSESQSQQQSQSPSEKAVEKLQQAKERMKQAEERLKKAERDEAVQEQEAALRELEQAKAELEKILRQLREEEMERMLVLLEARIRKMLEAQNAVYDQTVKLEESTDHIPEHELEIASASLGRQEDQIVNEADRALMLLREDGTTVAFPEALQQAREDMQTVADRLRRVKPDAITQGLEMDIIATLEETLAALQQALKELREQKASQQQGGGEPGEQPLVDQLAELRMIRALQNRVNGRTEFYDKLIEGDRTQEAELLEALVQLAQRQEQIFEATRDLHQGANQ